MSNDSIDFENFLVDEGLLVVEVATTVESFRRSGATHETQFRPTATTFADFDALDDFLDGKKLIDVDGLADEHAAMTLRAYQGQVSDFDRPIWSRRKWPKFGERVGCNLAFAHADSDDEILCCFVFYDAINAEDFLADLDSGNSSFLDRPWEIHSLLYYVLQKWLCPSCDSLEELQEQLESPHPYLFIGADCEKWPKFGGDCPDESDTVPVWSWDEERALIGEGDTLEIVTREQLRADFGSN